jgi:quinoprotein glucose dehydrogenase
LFPGREVAAPGSSLEGEVTAPTQPLPDGPKPWARQVFDAAEATRRTPEARAAVLAQLGRSAPSARFQPPDVRDTLGITGMTGGAVAVDATGVMYGAASEAAWILQMHPKRAVDGVPLGQTLFLQLCAPCHGPARTGNAALGIPSLVDAGVRFGRSTVEEMLHRGRGLMPPFAFLTGAQQNALIDSVRRGPEAAGAPAGSPPAAERGEEGSPVPYTTAGWFPFRDPDGFPALRPPWGALLAIDLNTGAHAWRRPLGETPGVPQAAGAETGAENHGGLLLTPTGVILVAATRDEKIRAFSAATGALLWEHGLPAGGYATPVTYTAGGRQFVVIACGGGRFGTKPGDAYVAFALPEE